MTAPAVLTYDTLISDVQTYCERSDDPFVAQLVRFVMLAENRLCSEVRGLGYQRYVTGTMASAQPILEKPERWRETISINYGSGVGNATRTPIFFRSYEFCRMYWPSPANTGAPRYMSDYNFEHWLVVPTPDDNYPFEIAYYERPEPLGPDNQTNWITEYMPQTLFYATLLETLPFLKLDDRMPAIQALYDRAIAGGVHEDKRRSTTGMPQQEGVR